MARTVQSRDKASAWIRKHNVQFLDTDARKNSKNSIVIQKLFTQFSDLWLIENQKKSANCCHPKFCLHIEKKAAEGPLIGRRAPRGRAASQRILLVHNNSIYLLGILDDSRDHSPSLLSRKNIYPVLYASHHTHTYYMYNLSDNKYF